MNVDSKQFLAQGRVSHVYRTENGKILKLLHATVPIAEVENEFTRCRIVKAAGVASPQAIKRVEVDGRQGIIFEEAGTTDLMQAKLGNPLNIASAGRFMAKVHLEVLSQSAAELDDIKGAISRLSQRLPEGTIHSSQLPLLETYLDQLPNGNHVCHLDFQPANIMLGPSGHQVIDWGLAVKGAAVADVAMTSLLLTMGNAAPGTNLIQRLLIPIFRKSFERHYRTFIKQHSSITDEKLNAWTLAVAILRLGIWDFAIEREFLSNLIQHELKNLEATR